MPFIITAAGIATAVGGVYSAFKGGGKGGGQESSSKKELDPRMQEYIYGPDGKGGLLGDTNAIYNAGKGGLNQQMVDGLNQQHAVYTNPANQAGYQNMASMGQSLMGGGVAGNPFTSGGAGAGLLSNIKGLQRPGGGMGGMGAPGGLMAGGSPMFSGGPASMAPMGGQGGPGGPFKLPNPNTVTAPQPMEKPPASEWETYNGEPIHLSQFPKPPKWDGNPATLSAWVDANEHYTAISTNQGGS